MLANFSLFVKMKKIVLTLFRVNIAAATNIFLMAIINGHTALNLIFFNFSKFASSTVFWIVKKRVKSLIANYKYCRV
jgi:hypothetical protein